MMPPRVLASGPKPCGGNNKEKYFTTWSFILSIVGSLLDRHVGATGPSQTWENYTTTGSNFVPRAKGKALGTRLMYFSWDKNKLSSCPRSRLFFKIRTPSLL